MRSAIVEKQWVKIYFVNFTQIITKAFFLINIIQAGIVFLNNYAFCYATEIIVHFSNTKY